MPSGITMRGMAAWRPLLYGVDYELVSDVRVGRGAFRKSMVGNVIDDVSSWRSLLEG